MAYLNEVRLIGRVGRDPETLGNNGDIVTIPIATSYGNNDKQKTDWHQIKIWDASKGSGKFTLDYIRKGDLVFVSGRLTYSTYTKKGTDVEVRNAEIWAFDVQILAKKAGSETEQRNDYQNAPERRQRDESRDKGERSPRERSGQNRAYTQPENDRLPKGPPIDIYDDDVPF